MADLYWPGDQRAGDLFTGVGLIGGMIALEAAWSHGLVEHGLAPAGAEVSAEELLALLSPADLEQISVDAEGGGNPVIALAATLRNHLQARDREVAARWLHRGLTSQDVVDTALMTNSAAALAHLAEQLDAQIAALETLARVHRGTVMVGRTLTQHAVPITFGAKVAGWVRGLRDAAAEVALARSAVPAQIGGAAGTLAATVELARARGLRDPESIATTIATDVARALGLQPSPPWHTTRTPVTRIGDTFATATSAMGRIATDVLVLARPEVAEVGEPAAAGRGGSSTMPQKQNPVLSVLIRRAAITNPGLAATLHLAAGLADDERPSGAWHAEWPTLRDLARRTVVAAAHATELVRGLRVEAGTMGQRAAAADGLLAERDSVRKLADAAPEQSEVDPTTYVGAVDALIEADLTDPLQPRSPQ